MSGCTPPTTGQPRWPSRPSGPSSSQRTRLEGGCSFRAGGTRPLGRGQEIDCTGLRSSGSPGAGGTSAQTPSHPLGRAPAHTAASGSPGWAPSTELSCALRPCLLDRALPVCPPLRPQGRHCGDSIPAQTLPRSPQSPSPVFLLRERPAGQMTARCPFPSGPLCAGTGGQWLPGRWSPLPGGVTLSPRRAESQSQGPQDTFLQSQPVTCPLG